MIVALMHTVAVAALGVCWWLLLENAPDIGAVTGWLQLLGSLIVLAVGLGLLRHHRRARQHGHGHGQGHGHSHGHAAGGSLLTRRGIVLLGASGGLLPSPTAFLVLLTGLLTDRVGVALLMVLAFGVGMATILAALGLAVLHGRDAVLRRAAASPRLQGWQHRIPLLGALLVVTGGAVSSVLALTTLAT